MKSSGVRTFGFLVAVVFLLVVCIDRAAGNFVRIPSSAAANYGYDDTNELEDGTSGFDQESISLIDNTKAELTAVSGEEEDNAEASSSASVQFMITQRMRRVLESELGYLPTEVDVMEPQIAAVVIERGLARPSKGMPSTWRRSEVDKRVVGAGGNPLNALQGFIEGLQQALKNLGAKIAPTLPVVLPVAASLLGVKAVLHVMENGGYSLLRAAFAHARSWRVRLPSFSRDEDNDRVSVKSNDAARARGKSQLKSTTSRASKSKGGNEPKGLVDISSLQQVQDEDFFDHVKLNFDILRHKYI